MDPNDADPILKKDPETLHDGVFYLKTVPKDNPFFVIEVLFLRDVGRLEQDEKPAHGWY